MFGARVVNKHLLTTTNAVFTEIPCFTLFTDNKQWRDSGKFDKLTTLIYLSQM